MRVPYYLNWLKSMPMHCRAPSKALNERRFSMLLLSSQHKFSFFFLVDSRSLRLLLLLRVCVELLRRLSKSEHTVFCGRICKNFICVCVFC
jgi:hypothetical protein